MYISSQLLFESVPTSRAVSDGESADADVTTKDLLTSHSLSEDPPCWCGRRNPLNLLRSYRTVCCGPIRSKYGVDQHRDWGMSEMMLSHSDATDV